MRLKKKLKIGQENYLNYNKLQELMDESDYDDMRFHEDQDKEAVERSEQKC